MSSVIVYLTPLIDYLKINSYFKNLKQNFTFSFSFFYFPPNFWPQILGSTTQFLITPQESLWYLKILLTRPTTLVNPPSLINLHCPVLVQTFFSPAMLPQPPHWTGPSVHLKLTLNACATTLRLIPIQTRSSFCFKYFLKLQIYFKYKMEFEFLNKVHNTLKKLAPFWYDFL